MPFYRYQFLTVLVVDRRSSTILIVYHIRPLLPRSELNRREIVSNAFTVSYVLGPKYSTCIRVIEKKCTELLLCKNDMRKINNNNNNS